MKSFLSRLGSMRITLTVLLFLAGGAAFGTFLPRGPGLEGWEKAIGTTGTRVAVALGFTDFFHSVWFVTLLGILVVNLLACTANRVPGMLASLSGKTALGREAVIDLPDSDKTRKNVFEALRSLGFRGPADKEAMTFNRGASGYLFTLLTHGSVLIIMAASILGSTMGFIATQRIYVGDTINTAYNWKVGDDRPLPFEVRVEDFTLEPNPTGVRLGIMEVQTRRKGKIITTHVGGTFEIPGVEGTVIVESFDTEKKDFNAFWVKTDGSRIQIRGEEEIGDTGFSLVPVAFAEWPERQAIARVTLVSREAGPLSGEISVNHPMVSQKIRIYLTDYGQDRFGLSYVGFQFVRDPGQAGVWVGCILFMLCVTGAIFIRQSCAVIVPHEGRIRIHLSSRENRDRVIAQLQEKLVNGTSEGILEKSR